MLVHMIVHAMRQRHQTNVAISLAKVSEKVPCRVEFGALFLTRTSAISEVLVAVAGLFRLFECDDGNL